MPVFSPPPPPQLSQSLTFRSASLSILRSSALRVAAAAAGAVPSILFAFQLAVLHLDSPSRPNIELDFGMTHRLLRAPPSVLWLPLLQLLCAALRTAGASANVVEM